MTIVNFAPWPALLGGLLIGSAAAVLMAFNGRIAGISGITKGLFAECPTPRERFWRVAFLAGLLLGGSLLVWLGPASTAAPLQLNPLQMSLGGLLVGVGTALGNGCTSGHGVCGLGRRSPRSLGAVMTFMAAGFAMMLVMSRLGLGLID